MRIKSAAETCKRYNPGRTDEEPAHENRRRSIARSDPSATRARAEPVVYSAEYEPPEQLIRPFTTVARPMQEGLAFHLKGSIGVLADGAPSARDPTAPSALTDPGLVLVRPGLPGPLG